ncbi:MAG: MarR family transcriptional regulator [Ruminococcus sp.]|nr:MarR family transcriptional regulator [Ruminococcus sp.]
MTRENHIGFQLKSVMNLMCRRNESNKLLQKTAKLTGMHGWIIGYLSEHQGEEIYQKDIEARFSMRRSTVSGVLQLMEKNGLLVRESVEGDRRLKRLTLTQKAIDLHQQVLAEIDQTEQLLRQDIPDEEITAFLKTLNKIRSNLEASVASMTEEKQEGQIC